MHVSIPLHFKAVNFEPVVRVVEATKTFSIFTLARFRTVLQTLGTDWADRSNRIGKDPPEHTVTNCNDVISQCLDLTVY